MSVKVAWPHRADDWRLLETAGTGFVAERDGEVIGTGLSWRYGADRASLGMVIVSPDHQGQGIGRQLMERLIAALEGRAILLHATPAGKPLYEKLGFRAVGTVDQHQGTVFQPPLISLPPGERLRPLGANDAPRLAELASRACGLERQALFPLLLDVADGIALDRDGELLGFALFRRFGRGFTIGPVVAPDAPGSSRAKALISHWLALNEGVFVRMDTPGDSGLTQWLEGLGMPRVDTVVKMVRGAASGPLVGEAGADANAPAAPKAFGIISQALG
nr:GNAT family N-acetyltransferase [Robbsia betulipollinis]